MLPKERRLSRKAFLQVIKSGKSYQLPNLAVKFLSNNLDSSRFAIVTSAKLSKSAVIRNHLRRRIYHELSTINYQQTFDIIFFPKTTMLKLTDEELASAIDSALSKILQ